MIKNINEKNDPSRIRRLRRIAASAAIIVFALIIAVLVWQFYVLAPWTRDGRVRVQVASIAPQVSGQIVEVRVVDNQFVRKGDIVFVIDRFDFQVSVQSAKAEVKNRSADLQVKRAQAARRASLTTVSTSVEEKQQFAGTPEIAQAAYEMAQAQLSQAEINLKRTEVRSPVNGFVNNLLLRVGDYARTGMITMYVLDTDSYWIDGYFEETKMARIRVGDSAEATLMGYSTPIRGRVESITRGIATSNAATSTQGLPNVDPVYTWVRLAQRVPVRIHIESVPDGVPLVAGMTATVVVTDTGRSSGDRLGQTLATLSENLASLFERRPANPGAGVTTTVTGSQTVSTIPADAPRSPPSPDTVTRRLPMSGGQAEDPPPPPGGSSRRRGGSP